VTGYVRLHRSLIGHPAFRNDAEAMAFAWMVARAAWKPSRVRYKGRAISLNRGQLAISVRDMATAMDRDKAWIERLFTRLKGETMIETESQSGVSVVTITNYGIYQCDGVPRETPGETPHEIDARQTRDTEQEREKGKKKVVERGTRLPANFSVPDEWREWTKSELGWTDADVDAEALVFADHWKATPGSKGVKLEWEATWRNWVRRSFRKPGSTVAAQQPADPSKWTPERRAAYARAMDSPDDPASRVRQVRGVGEIIQGIGR